TCSRRGRNYLVRIGVLEGASTEVEAHATTPLRLQPPRAPGAFVPEPARSPRGAGTTHQSRVPRAPLDRGRRGTLGGARPGGAARRGDRRQKRRPVRGRSAPSPR